MIGGIDGAGVGSVQSPRTGNEAAKAFEAMFLKQLLSAMGGSSGTSKLFGEGFQGEMFMDMFMTSVADSAAGGAGIGLGGMIEGAMGLETAPVARAAVSASRGAVSYGGASAASDVASNRDLAAVAEEWLGDGRAARWSKDGKLDAADLGANLRTEARGGEASFNVRDAGGYEGHNKCNLFAFEMIRRAGYDVPLAPRSKGWGFMGADTVARKAASGKVDWADVRTGWDAGQLDAVATSGVPLLMASGAPGDREGHMGVADRIHSIQRGANGEIEALEYSGWEAGAKGARYGRHIWRTVGQPGTGRGGLDAIEILVPRRSPGGGSYHLSDRGLPGASVLDAPGTESAAQGFANSSDNGR